jgi:quinoprotein glucose dehydrogenase
MRLCYRPNRRAEITCVLRVWQALARSKGSSISRLQALDSFVVVATLSSNMFRKLSWASSRGLFCSLLACGILSIEAGEAKKESEAAHPAPAKRSKKDSKFPEPDLAIKSFKIATNLEVSVFASEPMLANPVCFTIDEKGRFYVAETFRHTDGAIDNRHFQSWIDEELANKTVEDRLAMLKRHADEVPKMFNEWTRESEKISLIEDTDGDGKADKYSIFAEGFTNALDGVGAGVLARNGDVYFTCMPNLYLMRDKDGDGKQDEQKVLSTGYGVRYAFIGHDLHGLRVGPDGRLYFSCGDRGFSVMQNGKKIALPECGGVLRCNMDGSDLEVFASGMRNPQELAFDDYGNLFTGDNNADHGDHARWVYVTEGGDSGWRVAFQYVSEPVPLGPWNSEKMWHTQHEGQPAYIVPPVANLGNGPSGLTHYPGVGLPERYDNHFFLCDFKGQAQRSLVHSFANSQKGASFELVDRNDLISDVLVTDIEFGPDCSAYITDWVQGWDKPGIGRIYKIAQPELAKSELALETKKLLGEGMAKRELLGLLNLLGHRDQRVRMEAQFELASRNAAGPLAEVARNHTNILARIHAIWGLGQIGRNPSSQHKDSGKVSEPLIALLDDKDPEIRAQAARVLADDKHSEAATAPLIKLLQDVNYPRVQYFAVTALGKTGGKDAVPPIIEMLRANNDQDAVLRHAGVMALVSINDLDQILAAAKDPSPAVRLAAVVALRRLERPEIATLLQDKQLKVAVEAARGINDLPITEALPQLAALVEEPNYNQALFRRALNANYRLGKKENALALAKLAARKEAPDALRAEALELLSTWVNPSGRDRISGLWRPVTGERKQADASSALEPLLSEIFKSGQPLVQMNAAKFAAHFGVKSLSPVLFEAVSDTKGDPYVRIEALRALAAMNDAKLADALKIAFEDANAQLRKEAISLQSTLKPADASGKLLEALERGTIGEKQTAFVSLGNLKDASADQILEQWMDKLIGGKVEPELQLDLLEAAAKRDAAGVKERVKKFEEARPAGDDLAKWRECLAGGNAGEGKKIFFERVEASCLRCHKVHGEGGEVGPILDGIASKKMREYFLESVILPNKQIAPEFRTLIVSLKNGTSYAGILKSEDKKQLVINSPEDGIVKVPIKDIEKRDMGMSGMPPNFAEILSKQDIRNLVEYLSTLKN